MEDKIDHCTTSSDTTSLLEELSVYMTVTEDEQNARVEQVRGVGVWGCRGDDSVCEEYECGCG